MVIIEIIIKIRKFSKLNNESFIYKNSRDAAKMVLQKTMLIQVLYQGKKIEFRGEINEIKNKDKIELTNQKASSLQK